MALTVCSAALITSTSAVAQTAPAAQPALSHGAALPGVCFLSAQEVAGTSTVGKAVNTRMQQLVSQVQAELKPEQDAIQTEAQTLQSSAATMDAATREKRGNDWANRVEAFNQKAQLREAELERTRQKALQRILQEIDPVAKQVYQQRRCSILLSRDSGVTWGNPAMDLTPAVLQGLNAKIQTFAFERERIQAPAATPAAK